MENLKPLWELGSPLLVSNTPIVSLHLRSAVLVTKDKVCQVYIHIVPAAEVSAKVKIGYSVQLHSEMIQSMELHCGPFSLSAVSFFHRYTVPYIQYCLELLMTWLQLNTVNHSQNKEETFVYACKRMDLPGFCQLVNSFLYLHAQCSTFE